MKDFDLKKYLAEGKLLKEEEFLKHQIEFLGDRISNEINNRMEELANKYSANLNEINEPLH